MSKIEELLNEQERLSAATEEKIHELEDIIRRKEKLIENMLETLVVLEKSEMSEERLLSLFGKLTSEGEDIATARKVPNPLEILTRSEEKIKEEEVLTSQYIELNEEEENRLESLEEIEEQMEELQEEMEHHFEHQIREKIEEGELTREEARQLGLPI